MDKADASQAIRHGLGALGIEAVIPPRPAPECSYRGSNRTEALAYDKEKDKLRKKVERFFNKLKQFRRMATRDEKLSRTFMALIHLVSTWMIRQHGLINGGEMDESETKRDVDYEGRCKTNSFCSVNSSIAYFTPSRPSPESFTPP